ncbi:dihydrolipoyl dehydrogenase [Anaplasma phagocytophilum str. Norway variant1]|uniref:Dihydrolipoyl dehydrogenase n=1 Tax=Anaplasma phagocytophilum str. Norway variant1 TaxID=1392506 RepID=A0A7H9DXQ7_ANAPH|nr:dihydrolipoyl dehydrogenase [Anaplasma phagocytophilum]QLL66378.1 dihydrolipoyl dehydrogenase [Anaplasma phagocytophilum str. Norway variant1]
MDKYEVVIIGSGPGGYIAAIRAAQLGYKVAIVERENNLGGVCLNWGCIPTKALLKSAQLYKKILSASSFGIKITGDVEVDIQSIVAHSRDAVAKLSCGVSMLMKKNGVKVYKGCARIAGKGEIHVDNDGVKSALSAKHIILATGGRPRIATNLDTKLLWSSKDAMLPETLPKSLLIIGSGAIGIEFASFYSTLGSKVTIVEMQDRILPLEDRDISLSMHEILKNQGVDIFTACSVMDLVQSASSITAQIVNSGTKDTVTSSFERVICAIGILPNSGNLGLEDTKVQLDKGGFIITDSMCQTSEPGIYAIGDVAGPPCLAHKASHEAVICVEGIAKKDGRISTAPSTLHKNNIPSCIYSIPQIASVGLTEDAAKAQGLEIKVGISRASCNGKAIASGESEGFVKVILCSKTGELLGAHMLGSEVTEMINGYIVGRQLEATDLDIAHTIFPHPTLSEMMHSAILSAWKEPLDS